MDVQLIPGTMIEESDFWFSAVNRNQDLLGKTMLVLRRECSAVIDVQPDEWTALQAQLRRLVPALGDLFSPDHFNFAFLMNADAQVHLHVVPRYASARTWRDLRFEDDHWGTPANAERVLDPTTLSVLADEIRDAVRAHDLDG